MFVSLKRILLTAGLILVGGLPGAAQPPATEPLPQPRPLGPALVPIPYAPSPYVRTSQYAVWQSYGVDRQGYFKPLVVYSPCGAYYRYDGRPFPWAAVHPLEWMPRVVDEVPFRPAYPAGPPLIIPGHP